ncbi:MAG TPA: hypothetical protein PLU45_02130, partial [Bacteroidales bacterium]|nr:hypothetical protein [Bacteroidales bacterium]
MRKQLITLLFLICGLISKAQQKSETYYKDYYLTKEVNKKKAKFKKIETKNTNELINIQIFNLSNN